MEPIDGVERIPKSRWKLVCYICNKPGACIQCASKSCYLAFHVSCARRAKLSIKFKGPMSNLERSHMKAFCDKHCPVCPLSQLIQPEHMEEYDVAEGLREAQMYFSHARYNPITSSFEASDTSGRRTSVSRSGRITINLKRSTISARPSGSNTAVVPAAVYNRVLASIQKFTLRRKSVFVAEMCKYWSLKRESRRGASLLKRLQLALEGESARKYTRDQAERRLQVLILMSD
jgi:NuA3 HAT complex component NTO1